MHGGINLCCASIDGPAAYLGSISLSQPLVEMLLGWPPGSSLNTSSTVTSLSITVAPPDWQSLDYINVPLHQHSLFVAIDDVSYHQLFKSAPSAHLHALVLSSGLPHAGEWLNMVSSSALSHYLRDCEFYCCLRYWFGVPLHSQQYTCLVCGRSANLYGDHQVSYGGNGDCISRHNGI